MTAIWLLSTRGRQKQAQQVIDACEATGMTSPGIVYIDGCRYPNLRLPGNWTAHTDPRHLGLQGSLQYVYASHPEASQYGWLADDTLPRTPGWDKQLEQAAGEWNLAYARDLWLSEIPSEAQLLKEGYNLSSGLCWGGSLVRAVGWWALPGVFQAGIDTAWTTLVRPWGQHRYVDDVTVEHLHWRADRRPKDTLDEADWIDRDIIVRDHWTWSPAFRAALAAAGHGQEASDAVRWASKNSAANQRSRDGKQIPQARLLRLMEEGAE